MGRSKLTLELGGKTFLQRAVTAATGAQRVGRCLVVLRPEDAGLLDRGAVPASSTPDRRAPELVLNPLAAQGQSASIRLSTARLVEDPDCEGVIFAVVDQPFIQADVFDALAAAWERGEGEILVSSYAGQRGNPVLFARRFFPELQALSGDVGGREVLRRHPELVRDVPIADPRAGRDVDTWEEFLEAQRSLADLGDVQMP